MQLRSPANRSLERILLPSSTRARCQAAQELIRPKQVAALVGQRLVPPLQFVGNVADWLATQFRTGRLSYIPDPNWANGWDEWCSPALTLHRGGGDCDDLAILATSLIQAGGVFATMVVGTALMNGQLFGHAWVEGIAGKQPFHLEATGGAFHNCRPLGYWAETFLAPGICWAA